MKYYMAPLEGITSYIYRSTYDKYFCKMDKYFTPFLVSPNFNLKEKLDLSPENNLNINLVPQILSKDSDEFIKIAKSVSEYGYTTVNLNLGCPAGTVVSKKRGSGMLSDLYYLDNFLYELFANCPLNISIKTRIGIWEQYDEWEEILDIYSKYNMEELIIHPRYQKEFYKGKPHLDAFIKATTKISIPLCYNGDIFAKEDFELIKAKCPSLDNVMLGRGILKNPGLLASINGTKAPTKSIIKDFHDDLFEQYQERMSGEMPTLYKMIELWTYMESSFTNPEKYMKKIKKAKHFSEYKAAVNALFTNEDYITL